VDATTRTLKQRAYHGFKEYLVISCYLWVVFGLFAIYKSVILAEHNIALALQGVALLNALALAKVMLIAKELHFADHFKCRLPINAGTFLSGENSPHVDIHQVLADDISAPSLLAERRPCQFGHLHPLIDRGRKD
jgi:hypothetical protein